MSKPGELEFTPAELEFTSGITGLEIAVGAVGAVGTAILYDKYEANGIFHHGTGSANVANEQALTEQITEYRQARQLFSKPNTTANHEAVVVLDHVITKDYNQLHASMSQPQYGTSQEIESIPLVGGEVVLGALLAGLAANRIRRALLRGMIEPRHS